MQKRGILAYYASRPAQLLAVSFFLTIAVGTVLLMLPLAATGAAANIYDALFTATSAVCVTGLTVQDTPVFFTNFGLVVILLLIQVGGLGITTISSAAALAIKRGLGLGQRMVMQQMMDQTYYEELRDLLKRIVRGTFLIEGVGALVLSIAWYDANAGYLSGLWKAVFHAVSAFCNAGFALFSDNLMSFQGHPVVLVTHAVLIVVGGIGFTIIGPLLSFRLPRGIHARLAVVVSLILIFAGALFFLVVESTRSMVGEPLGTQWWNALFQSVSARTAGFNSVDINAWSDAPVLVLVILMFIGASPGSTGGGIKTTTIGVLVLSLVAVVRGREDVEYHGRRIPQDIVTKSISIMLLSLALVTVFTLALMITETAPFRSILFEVVSAFGTVGLSLGITPTLTSVGKVLLSVLMYVGRIGPLTVAMIVGEHMVRTKYKYPEERIMVG